MTIAALRVACFACAVFVSGTPAFAASQTTQVFLANLQTNVAFLDHSSRIAAERSGTAGVRDFARGEAAEQAQLARDLNAVMPLIAATDSDVVTGRSVAIDGQVGSKTQPSAAPRQAANGRAPLALADAEKMTTLSGRALDDVYWEKQLDALSQLEADYRAYIAQGDDPALVAMAQAELPKIVRRLEALSKI